MKIFSLLFVILTIFIVGCEGFNDPYKNYRYTSCETCPQKKIIAIHIDPRFHPEDQKIIRQYLSEFEYVVSNYYKFLIVDTIEGSNKHIVYDSSITRRDDNENIINLGNATIGGQRITLSPYAVYYYDNGVKLGVVLLHELGHSFGCEHQDMSLMAASYNFEYTCVDKNTAIQIANYNGLDIDKLNYCDTAPVKIKITSKTVSYCGEQYSDE